MIASTQALRAYTSGSAEAIDRLHDLGTLEKGKLADVIVIDRNLFEIDKMEIKDCHVDLTIMDGKVVYKR